MTKADTAKAQLLNLDMSIHRSWIIILKAKIVIVHRQFNFKQHSETLISQGD